MPKISVIMSAYNAEKYIKEAIDSVLNQTFKDFEFIIINDASTDSTRDIILSYKDSRIRPIENKKNLGLTKSLNNGLGIARGKYVARIDTDDVWTETCLEEKMDYMNKHPDVAVVGSWAETIGVDFGRTYVLKYDCDPDIIKWTLMLKNQIAHSSAFFKTDIIKEVGGYNERYRYSQDFDLWFRVSRKHKIANVPRVLLKYRIHGKSITKIPKTRRRQKQLVLEVLFNNINYYINLSQKDFKIFINAVKWAKISSFKNFIKVRKFYKHLFSSYIRKENLDKEDIKKILPDYKKKKDAMLKWYVKCLFKKHSKQL